MTQKPIEFDGMTFGADEISVMRESMIRLRNAALETSNFEDALTLSCVIVVLKHVADWMKSE